MDRQSFVAVALAVLAQTSSANVAELAPGAGNRTLDVDLPPEVFARAGAALMVELDGYDVSAFSSVADTTLRIDLDTPLAGGRHSLNVLLFLPDGGIEVVVDAIVVAPELHGAQWSANTTLQTSYRTDGHPDPAFRDLDRSAANGALSLGGERVSSEWRLTSKLDAIYDGGRPDGAAHQDWLLPSYELSATHLGAGATTSVGAGNIAIAGNDFVFSRFQRRGAAVGSVGTSGRFEVRAFNVASAPRNGFDGGYLAPGDSNDRASGVATAIDLVEDRLRIGGAFIDGKTAFGGAGFNPLYDAAVYGGNTWNVSVDSRPAEGSVWLRLERAQSEFDADGLRVGLPARKDDALAARLRFSSTGRFGKGPFEFWSVDMLRKRVGTHFYSVGNLAQPGNVEIDALDLEAGVHALTLALELSEQRTNPDDDPLLPTQTLERAGLDLTYTPAALDPDKRWWRLLGAPSLRAWAVRSATNQPDEDAVLAGYDLEDRTDEAGIAVGFARAALSWAMEVGVIDYADRSEALIENGFVFYEPASDTRNAHSSVQVTWTPGPRVTFDAYVQRNAFDDRDFGDERRTTNYGLSGTFFLLPDALSLFVSANRGRDRLDYGDGYFLPERFRSRFASVQLDWRVREAAGRRPGIGLYLKANYGRNEDVVFLLEDGTSSMHVGVDVSWAHDR